VRTMWAIIHAHEVQVRYVRAVACRRCAQRCVLACYNAMISLPGPELPEAQKAALHSLVKSPLVYTRCRPDATGRRSASLGSNRSMPGFLTTRTCT